MSCSELLQFGGFFFVCLIFLNWKERVDKEIIRDTVLRVLPNCTWLYGPCCYRHYQAWYCLVAQNGVFSLLVQFALACWWVDIYGKPRCPAKRPIFVLNQYSFASAGPGSTEIRGNFCCVLSSEGFVLSRNCFVFLICAFWVKHKPVKGEVGGNETFWHLQSNPYWTFPQLSSSTGVQSRHSCYQMALHFQSCYRRIQNNTGRKDTRLLS